MPAIIKTGTLQIGDIIRSPLFANQVWNGETDGKMHIASRADFAKSRQYDEELQPDVSASLARFLIYAIGQSITGGGYAPYYALRLPSPGQPVSPSNLVHARSKIWFHAEVVPEVELIGRLNLKIDSVG